MNSTAISIVKELSNGSVDTKTLMQNVGIKEWQLNSQLKDLIQQGYAQKEENTVKLQESAKSAIVRDLVKKLNIEKILRGANEIIYSYLTEPISINEIILKTDLSTSTVYRAISDFESVGAIIKDGDKIIVNKSDEQLALLANILKTERNNMYEPNAEIIYQDSSKILKKVIRGKVTEGQLTGFSLFIEYGIEYHTNFDYYIKQDEPLDIQHVLIHAVYDSQRIQDKIALTMAIIFYLKNKAKMDILNLRQIAESFKIANVWIDIEGYIRNNELKNPNLFLPKQEFVEKADLYDISPDLYTLPEGYPKLFEEIGANLQQFTRAYLIGGENMRIKGLKARTKDIDIVVETKEDYESIVSALTKLGYTPRTNEEFSREDLRIYPSIMMIHPNRSQIDLYIKKILRTLSLSDTMIARTDLADFGNLRLGVLRNEDVFLLKAVTSREADIQDMAELAKMNYVGDGKFRQRDFNWDIVWEEILRQEGENKVQSYSDNILQNIELMIQQTAIIPPFRNKLQRFVLDKKIIKLVREGRILLKDVVSLLESEINSESTIRNRIEALVRDNELKKENIDNDVFISPMSELIFPEQNLKIIWENLEKYLKWRFPTRNGPTIPQIQRFTDEILSAGKETIDELDEIVRNSINKLKKYEKTYYPNEKLSQVGALRVCIGLSDPTLGRNGTTNFYISDFDKFVGSED
ncbi:MAG: hypothetical protein HY222_01640 [Thaumarchaeota archaeon]|nr:hypothetical protein [Nitrososphaerota archaeon]MBI3641077.1 hypothetical protein [Nitrososphaerota archaeon]